MKAAKFYAQILIEVATGKNGLPTIESAIDELKVFNDAMKESSVLARVFTDPTINESERAALINGLKQKMALGEFAVRFLLIMAKRGRVTILQQVLDEVDLMRTERAGGLVGEISSAEALSAETLAAVSQALEKKLSKKVSLRQKLDPSLIAGMKVIVSGKTYDGTVRAKLDRARENFA